jgi:hypothetical protein
MLAQSETEMASSKFNFTYLTYGKSTLLVEKVAPPSFTIMLYPARSNAMHICSMSELSIGALVLLPE